MCERLIQEMGYGWEKNWMRVKVILGVKSSKLYKPSENKRNSREISFYSCPPKSFAKGDEVYLGIYTH